MAPISDSPSTGSLRFPEGEANKLFSLMLLRFLDDARDWLNWYSQYLSFQRIFEKYLDLCCIVILRNVQNVSQWSHLADIYLNGSSHGMFVWFWWCGFTYFISRQVSFRMAFYFWIGAIPRIENVFNVKM